MYSFHVHRNQSNSGVWCIDASDTVNLNAWHTHSPHIMDRTESMIRHFVVWETFEPGRNMPARLTNIKKKKWQHQEQHSRKMVDFRSDVIVLSAKISQTPDKRLNIICQRKLAWMRLAVRCLSQLFDDDIFFRTILFFICNIESFSFDSYWLIDFHAFVTVTYGWHFKSFQIVG